MGGGLKEALQSVSLKISSWLVGVLYLDIINEDIVLVCALALLCLMCVDGFIQRWLFKCANHEGIHPPPVLLLLHLIRVVARVK